MKRILFSLAVLTVFGIVPSFAAPAVDAPTVVSTLIDHVHAQTIFDVSGKTRLELTDSILQMIPYRGGYVIEGQAGFSGTTVPQAGEPLYGHFVASAFINAAPYLKGVIIIPDDYALLRSIELGPVYGYDFTEHHGYLGFQANLSFGLNPVR